MTKRFITNSIVTLLLIIMFCLCLFSIKDDSATMDELAHIPAGYSYITQKDMRLNPEHPPLLKDLAGLSAWIGSKLTASPIFFPKNVDSWQIDVNGQWTFGREFLYYNGNDADQIIFHSRIPMILLGLLLGFYVFKWTKELYGKRAGLFSLLLFVFSPTFLAHTRYVTTDVGAAAAFFIATYYLIKWLKDSTKKNLIYAGIGFGLAMLTKFSLALLVPYFILLVIVASLTQGKTLKNIATNETAKKLFKNLVCLFLIGLIALALIWPVYQYHIWNYPPARQYNDTAFNFQGVDKLRPAIDSLIWASDKPLLRPYAQYFLGLIMVMRRAAGGNTAYFLGEINNQSWWYYFPVTYWLKVPLSFHLLTLIALIYALMKIKRPFLKKPFERLYAWLKKYFTEFAILTFLVVYWVVSIRSNLNIGVRHVLPIFPFAYVLISGQLSRWVKIPWSKLKEQTLLWDKIKETAIAISKSYLRYSILLILIIWYLAASISIYPNYLAFFNISIGGADRGHEYVLDSNLDWGQDLKRLNNWIEDYNQCANLKCNTSLEFGCPSYCYKISTPSHQITRPIKNIHVHYFGGGDPEYYLQDKYWPWWGDRSPDDIKSGQWLAISATLLQEGRGQTTEGFDRKSDYYLWLNQHELVTKIGYSIFVYQIK